MLLIEEGWHSTIELADALDHAGFVVTVLTANGTAATHRRRGVQWTSGPTIASAEFLPHLAGVMRTTGFDRVLATTEAAMTRLWDTDGPWTAGLHPIADAEQRRLLRNKHALLDHMAACGVGVPRHRRIDHALDLDEPVRAFGWPLVVKGAVGSGGRMVRIVDTEAGLHDAVARARTLGGDWIVQEHVAGSTYLFGGLFRDGEPLRIYAGEKLEQYPPRTGGAIRIRSSGDPALVEVGLRVMRELRWTGFASADLVRRDGAYLLLEVNPRLWGSFAAARSAGVELFAPFAELLAAAVPRADLAFAADDECWIFPRYLNAPAHRDLAGARRALRDLRGPQGRAWRNPAFVRHILHRLYWMGRSASRF